MPGAGTRKYRMTLYIVGREARAEQARANIRAILADEIGEDEYVLEVIDVLEQPEMAEAARILATPTLVKEEPLPVRRVIGDLSDRQRVLAGLALETE